MELIRYKGNFVDCNTQIENVKQRTATAREGMIDRIKQGPKSYYKNQGCWHPEGTVRMDGFYYWCLQRFAPTTHYPQETLNANRNGNYLSLTKEIKLGRKPASQLIKEIAEIDRELPDYKKRILIPKNKQTFSVASDSLGDVDIAVFLARSQRLAEKYGNFLKKECRIDDVTFCQIPRNYDNVAAGFWLHWLVRGFGSSFFGNDRNFNYTNGFLFGVAKREALSKGKMSVKPTQKILYSKKQISKALKSTGLTGKVEKLVLSELR